MGPLKTLRYEALKDFAPVTVGASGPYILVANPSVSEVGSALSQMNAASRERSRSPGGRRGSTSVAPGGAPAVVGNACTALRTVLVNAGAPPTNGDTRPHSPEEFASSSRM